MLLVVVVVLPSLQPVDVAVGRVAAAAAVLVVEIPTASVAAKRESKR